MTILSAKRDTGTNSSNMTMVRLITTSFPQDIMLPGWISTLDMSLFVENHGGWQWLPTDILIIRCADPITLAPTHTLIGFISPDLSTFIPIGPINPNTQGIVPFNAGGQANATQLKVGINVVVNAANNGASVKLPPDVLDHTCIVVNRSGFTLAIYPSLGDEIDALGVNVFSPVSNNLGKMFIGVSAHNWAEFD